MIDLIRIAKDRIESYRALHGREPDCLVMNKATMMMLVEQSNFLKPAAKMPEIQGRPFIFMGCRIRISPTIADIHAAS